MEFKINKDYDKRTKAFIQSVLDQVEGIEGIDNGALSMLAFNYNVFIEESDRLMNEDMVIINVQGNQVANPRVKIVKDAQVQCLAILKEFGLTLKSRTTVKTKTRDSEDSPLESFIKGKKETR